MTFSALRTGAPHVLDTTWGSVMTTPRTSLFARLTPGGHRNFADDLRAENTGAILLLVGAVVALVWANSPAREGYASLSGKSVV